MRDTRKSISWYDLLPALAAAAGYVLGVLFITAGHDLLGGRNHAVFGAPQTLIWMSLVAAQIAFWFVAVPQYVRTVSDHRDDGRGSWPQIAVTLALLVMLMAIPAYFMAVLTDTLYELEGFVGLNWKRGIIGAGGALFGLLGATGMLLVKAAALRVFDSAGDVAGSQSDSTPDSPADPPPGPSPYAPVIRRYLALRGELQRLLVLLGTGVGLGTLSTGALRNAAVAAKPGSESLYRPELVLLLGIFLSATTALIYVPVYLKLAQVGGQIRDRMIPPDPPDIGELVGWQERRKAAGELLQLQASPLESLQAGFVILAPLASSILAVLVPSR
jgi:hypothetical protein